MIKTRNPEVKAKINHRLARIEGQLRGVQNMIDTDRDCQDILQQLIAIRAAIHAASLNFMQDVASDCLVNLESENDSETIQVRMADLIQMLGKLTK
jgi:CsoR family transcriptional regulator, copper-sensing transcriptional repressor